MKIMLVSTGRGAELCIFTSFVRKYREMYPDAEIVVGTGPTWKNLFINNKDISKWVPSSDGEMQRQEATRAGFDVVEDISEARGDDTSILDCMYKGIKDKRFQKGEIPRQVFITPSEKDNTQAKRLAKKYPGMILISHGCTSSKNALTHDGWVELSKRLAKYGPVCYTGTKGRGEMRGDPELPDAVDLRDLSYGALAALSVIPGALRCFVGLDTATTWVCQGTTARIVTLRCDPIYPLQSTGMVSMGYRNEANTKEIVVEGLDLAQILTLAENAVAG